MSALAPTAANGLAHPYTSKTLERKVRNKTDLQKELGWPQEPKRPMVCLPAGMSDALGGDLLENVLEGLLELPIEVIVLGKGSEKFGKLFTRLSKEHDHKLAILPNKKESLTTMLAAADMALFTSDPTGLPELTACLAFGVVPVSPECKALEAYDPIQESGQAFLYHGTSPWLVFGAVVRALESHKFPFDWRTIQKHCMNAVK